jgi:hypothetical protein
MRVGRAVSPPALVSRATVNVAGCGTTSSALVPRPIVVLYPSHSHLPEGQRTRDVQSERQSTLR